MCDLSTLVERIRRLCPSRNTSLTKLEEEFGWSNGTIGKWSKGKKFPAYDKLQLIANRLRVPMTMLLADQDEFEKDFTKEITEQKEPAALTDDELMNSTLRDIGYYQLSPENQALVRRLIEQLAEAQGSEE